MLEKYVTLQEAAELEGIEYHAMLVRLTRENLYKTKTVKDIENGGRERVYVALSSLSGKAKRVYREKEKIDVSAIDKEASAPWYTYADWIEYREKYKEKYNKAIELAKHIKECVEYEGGDKTLFVREYAGKIGVPERTLRRRMKQYAEGMSWAIKMGGEDGKNYEYMKILALCPKPKEPTGRTALNDEMKALIENIWFNPDFAVNQCKYAKLYRMFKEEAGKRGWDIESLPSYSTVVRYISDIRYTTDNARVMLTKGKREFRRVSMVKARREIEALKVMEVVVADTHTFDCFVEVRSENGKRRAVKPCLVGFMDMRSRALVGWSVCEIPNAQVIKETIISMIMEKKNKANPFRGVPRVLLIDNGKDYTAKCLTGRNRKVRVDIDDDVKGFYAEVGIEKDMRSLPYQAWTKGQIERFFGGVCEDFTKDMSGYIGTLTGSKTSGKVQKDIKRMFEKGELISIEEFADRFEYWVLEVYGKRKHKGLIEQNEKYLTPLEVYLNEERFEKAAPPGEYLERIAMTRIDNKKVYPTGIKLFGCEYMHEDLFPYINAEKGVTVRYNPKDVRKIKAYDAETDRLICEAETTERLNPLAPIGDKSLTEHIKRQKRHEKQAREIIEKGQKRWEERLADIENDVKTVITPEISENQKITRLPEDRKYIDELKKEDDQVREETDRWMKKYADGVLERIRRAGG